MISTLYRVQCVTSVFVLSRVVCDIFVLFCDTGHVILLGRRHGRWVELRPTRSLVSAFFGAIARLVGMGGSSNRTVGGISMLIGSVLQRL